MQPENYYGTPRHRQQPKSRYSWVLPAALITSGVAIWFGNGYHTAHRLHNAILDGDAATLARLVDWPAVQEQVLELAIERLSGQLERHGAKFGVQGVLDGMLVGAAVGSAIESVVSPTGIARLARSSPGGIEHIDQNLAKGIADYTRAARIQWSLPAGVATLILKAAPPGSARDKETTLTLEFRDWGWKLTRIDLPELDIPPSNQRGPRR